jgi:hypothetical protein
MTGRTKHPNSPNATHVIRLTERAFDKVLEMQEGNEPYGWVIERALDIRKKVRALEDLNRELKDELFHLYDANRNLLKIQRKQAEDILRLETLTGVINNE